MVKEKPLLSRIKPFPVSCPQILLLNLERKFFWRSHPISLISGQGYLNSPDIQSWRGLDYYLSPLVTQVRLANARINLAFPSTSKRSQFSINFSRINLTLIYHNKRLSVYKKISQAIILLLAGH